MSVSTIEPSAPTAAERFGESPLSAVLEEMGALEKPLFAGMNFAVVNPTANAQKEAFSLEINRRDEKFSFDCNACMPQRCYCYCNCLCACTSPSMGALSDIWN